MEAIIGHKKVIGLLNKAIDKKKLAHAYFFSGPKGVGKFTIALELAKKLAGQSNKINSDLIILAPDVSIEKGITKKSDIKIEEIRNLQHKVSLSANTAYKIVIIDEADRLNRTAQNALLKTLEEPNEKVILILVSQNDKRMLPTVLSRCQVIRFGFLSESEMIELVPVGTKKRDSILFWSFGRPGVAKKLLAESNEIDRFESTADEFWKIFSMNAVEKISLADDLSKDKSAFEEKIDLWIVLLRQIIIGKKASNISSKKALEIIDVLSETLDMVKSTNSNLRLVIENLLIKF